ncbi:MAG: ABC transporter ATP-binding protein [Gemmatimonadetes bacterium]|nr:ABC transporter ATP-binding protein [Gemmatimonadota bacterium]
MPSAEEDVILSVTGLRKSFGDLEAVRSLSLEIFRGEVFGFLGPNGAGKTTTIRLICGLLRADSGEIRIDGLDLRRNAGHCRRRIGLCPQDLVIWETLTCMEQLVFVGTQYDMSRQDARRRAAELLDTLGLAEKANRLAKTLSGGMKRRLNLALALVHDPDLLVLDEPQAGLDPQSRILVREYILSLAQQRTVLLTTHEMDEADRMASRIGIIDQGEILVLNTPDQLKDHHSGGEILELTVEPGADGRGSAGGWGPDVSQFLDGLPEGLSTLESLPGTIRLTGRALHERIPEVFESLRANDIEVQDVTLRKPTLEDVFVSLTGRGLRE